MKQRIAIVTGASSGMGRVMAKLLSERIVHLTELWIAARREDRLTELAQEIEALSEGEIRVRRFPVDLTKREERDVLSEALAEEEPEILFLVNAAGFGKLGTVSELSGEVQADMVRLNDEALLSVTTICLPYMKDKAGRILQFASAAAFLPQPQFAVYAASKAFVLSFSEALAEELSERRIAVTAVCPGPVSTEFFGIAEELHRVPLYKKMFYADPQKVCEKALSDSIRRKRVSVYGSSMKAFSLMARFLPHRVLFFAMRLINRGGF